MIFGVASYDYITRKRNLFFTQTNTYAIFLGACYIEDHFGYSMLVDSINNQAAEISALDYFNGNILIATLDTLDLLFSETDYFGSDIAPDVIDNQALQIKYPFITVKGNAQIESIYINNFEIVNKVEFDSNVSLIVFDLAEMAYTTTSHFDSSFTFSSVTYKDTVTYGNIHLEGNLGASQVGIVDLEDIEGDVHFTGNLDIGNVYTYGIGFELDDNFELQLELDPVSYHDIDAILSSELSSSVYLDSSEIVEDSYLMDLHLISALTGTTVGVTDLGGFTNDVHLESELEANQITSFVDSEFEAETELSAILTMDIIAGYIYPEFNQEVLHVVGNISSMYLMRDRYLNDDEFFNLSITNFLDLSIEDLLEIEI